VSHLYNIVGIKPVLVSPSGPDAGHRGSRIHQHAVQIEENATKQYSIHGLS
jgi:hypothetical protein